ADPSPIKGGAAAHKARAKAPTGRRLMVLSGGEMLAVPCFDAGGPPSRGPSATRIVHGEEMTPSPAGGSATAISSTPDSGSKSSAVSLGGEIAELSGGAPRLKSKLSSPPPVPIKRRREVGSSNEEEGRVEKRGRVAPLSDSDDDGATLTLLRRKRSVCSGLPRGDTSPPSMADGTPGGARLPSAPVTIALEACPAGGEGALTASRVGPCSPGVSDAQRKGPAAEPKLEALSLENVELVSKRTFAHVWSIWLLLYFSAPLLNADPSLFYLTCSWLPSSLSTPLASGI
ncbi:hypothetical protein PanWU01x14_226290, partial [Parasponia andersonii]